MKFTNAEDLPLSVWGEWKLLHANKSVVSHLKEQPRRAAEKTQRTAESSPETLLSPQWFSVDQLNIQKLRPTKELAFLKSGTILSRNLIMLIASPSP